MIGMQKKQNYAASTSRSGFNFDNCKRNAQLLAEGYRPPRTVKTGTSIVGIIYENGVILGADTRATEGPIVSDKNCSKIHRLQDYIYCCGAGTAADTEQLTQKTSSELDLHRLNFNRERVPVVCASRMMRSTLFRFQGHISAALVMGGVDKWGPQIYCIYPCGSNDKIPYAAMGSGTLAAMSVLEQRWHPQLTLDEGKQLVREAITAGVFNDLGSGSNIDMCVISCDKAKAEYLRTETITSERGETIAKYAINPNTTVVKSTSILSIEVLNKNVYEVSRLPSILFSSSSARFLPVEPQASSGHHMLQEMEIGQEEEQQQQQRQEDDDQIPSGSQVTGKSKNNADDEQKEQ
ncbi:proteasome subunit beta type-7 [Drosophila tropicalis]|uniref:proteasome subunit beta type-7 n=1 Tax=Drosophila tropicalis TaxID=46794 RepID=UPI0035AB8000